MKVYGCKEFTTKYICKILKPDNVGFFLYETEKESLYENLVDQSIVPKTRCFFHTQNYRLTAGQQKGRCRHRDLPD